jgi:predicted NAD-dependent protein-ADP-ribosyltransferase YbiA (DUF1768 family)
VQPDRLEAIFDVTNGLLFFSAHTVKKFFSKSKKEDDLGIGCPDWRKVLSNFYPIKFEIQGRWYASVEHAFHAAKARLCSDKPSIAKEFEVGGRVASDPQEA